MADGNDNIADEVVRLLGSGRYEQVRRLFLPELRPLVSLSALAAAWREAVGADSPPVVAGLQAAGRPLAGLVEVRVPLHTARGEATVVLSATAEGALAALQILPDASPGPEAAWKPPDYAQPERFEEIDCRVGQPPLDTPATMSVPRLNGPVPAVLMLAGSGPVDRDGTLGPRKPFKDLAWGMASRGIAVLRFDKITYSRPDVLARNPMVTIADEYLHHADAGLQILRTYRGIDARRLFVLGHSLGGTVAPRVALRHPGLAGLVVLAGAALPLHWTLVRQVRRLASLNPDADDAAIGGADEPAIDTLVEQARRVDEPGLSPATPRSALPLGLPASYWLDLRDYRAAEVAATVPQPMLILHGGRDQQATVAGDLAAWRAALAHRSDVTIRVFPDDDHLFAPAGSGGPADMQPTHVDPAVVRTCAEWVLATLGG